MTGQIVEITKPGYWLSKRHGFLEVSYENEKIGRIPFDDITTVIIAVPGCSISTVLIDQLSQHNIPLVICGRNYLPCSIVLPLQGYGRQYQVMQSQVQLTAPHRKRAWQRIVKAKIYNQAETLVRVGQESSQMERLARSVRSGDTGNCEAQAARIYWPRLFGSSFRRNQNSGGLNSALNYAYAIIRACVARGVVGAGLHPTFSLHHKNPQNPLNLVDDLMEPLRPIADYMIWQIGIEKLNELVPENKATLASITTTETPLFYGRKFEEVSPLSLATVKICRSFANYCRGARSDFLMPTLPNPLDLQGL